MAFSVEHGLHPIQPPIASEQSPATSTVTQAATPPIALTLTATCTNQPDILFPDMLAAPSYSRLEIWIGTQFTSHHPTLSISDQVTTGGDRQIALFNHNHGSPHEIWGLLTRYSGSQNSLHPYTFVDTIEKFEWPFRAYGQPTPTAERETWCDTVQSRSPLTCGVQRHTHNASFRLTYR